MQHNISESAALICSQQATSQIPAHAVACFKLGAGRAMSLTPKEPGELRIAHGRVWVTFANAAGDVSARAGDHFLVVGDLVHLQADQHLVMEGYEKNVSESVYFSWEPDAVRSRNALPRRARHTHDVRQPLRDLGAALHQAGGALARLAQGVAGNLACTLMRCNTAAR